MHSVSRPADRIVEVIEQFSNPCESRQCVLFGTMPQHFARNRLLGHSRESDAVTPQLPKHARCFFGAFLKRCQCNLGVAGQELAEGTPQKTGKDNRGDDLDAEFQIGRVSEDVIELSRKAGLREQIEGAGNVEPRSMRIDETEQSTVGFWQIERRHAPWGLNLGEA